MEETTSVSMSKTPLLARSSFCRACSSDHNCEVAEVGPSKKDSSPL